MANRKPLAIISGRTQELPATDTLDVGSIVATGQITGGLNNLAPGYLIGLVMTYNSTTSISVSTGAAEIESTGKILKAASAITKSSLSLSASTWYYLYFYNNSGTPDIEVSTTAPASPYSGTAHHKTGDSARRLIGAIRTDGSNNIFDFLVADNFVIYRVPTGVSPFRVLAAGSATTYTDVDCSAPVPPFVRAAYFRVTNLSTGAQILVIKTDDGTFGTGYFSGVEAQKQLTTPAPLNSTQKVQYKDLNAVGGGNFYLDVVGYFSER